MRTLERLDEMGKRVFQKRKASFRDYWRMVRNLPSFSKEVTRALHKLNDELKKRKETVAIQGNRSGVRSQPLPLAHIKERSQTGEMLFVVPIGGSPCISFDLAQVTDTGITFGSDETILTHMDDYSAVVYLDETSTAFREKNRFFLQSGRIQEFLATGGKLSEIR